MSSLEAMETTVREGQNVTSGPVSCGPDSDNHQCSFPRQIEIRVSRVRDRNKSDRLLLVRGGVTRDFFTYKDAFAMPSESSKYL